MHDEIYPDDPDPITPQELWACGLFEGEGCFTISTNSKTGYEQPRMLLSSTDEDVVRKFARIVDCGNVVEVRDFEKFGYKRQWRWLLGGRDEIRRLISLWGPYLGNRRHLRSIDLSLAFERRSIKRELQTT